MNDPLSALVYLLCFLTSALCAGLLFRQHRRSATPVLVWSTACFVLLALSNLLVVIDRLVMPDVSLRTIRLGVTLLAVSVLLYGFIWEAERD
jgi:hypothetical protein